MESARCESSTFAREEEQKSKDCLTAATSLSFESVSASLALQQRYTGNLGAEEVVGVGDVNSQMSEAHLSGVGLKVNLSAAWLRRRRHVFCGAGEAEAEGVADGICRGRREGTACAEARSGVAGERC